MSKFFDMNGTLGLPEMIEVEPTQSCNLRCRMCHVSYALPEKAKLLDVELVDKLKALRGAYISIGSGFEPMMHPQFGRLLAQLNELGGPIQLITNGTYCTQENIAALHAANMYLITFSFDGMRRDTYEYVRRRADYGDVVGKIRATREAFRDRSTYFAINNTVMRSTLHETLDTIDFWNEADFDVLRFLIMVVRFPERALLEECLYPIRDEARRIFDEAALHVIEKQKKIGIARLFHEGSPIGRRFPNNCTGKWVYSDNPAARRFPANFREKYLFGIEPRLPHAKCHAPFQSATILPNGDVQICYKYSVGNLHAEDFVDIWYGERADEARRKIIADASNCRTCDCYRFDIALEELDMDRRENHFSNELVPVAQHVDFDAGTFPAELPPIPPHLVASENGYSIVRHGGRYYGIPWSAGPIEVDKTDITQISSAFVEPNYVRAMQRLKQIQETAEAALPPHLIASENGYSIVHYRGTYYGIPWSAGPIEVDKADIAQISGAFVEPDHARAIRRLRQIHEAAEAALPPQLVVSENGYNIVRYCGRYYGIPWTAGVLEVDKVDIAQIDGAFVETSCDQALDRIRQMAPLTTVQ